MPINLTQGNSAQFVVEFLDPLGAPTSPSGGQLVINYTNASTFISTSQTITLTIGNAGLFTGTWNSAVAATGLAPWSVYATGSTAIAAQSDVIRVIDP